MIKIIYSLATLDQPPAVLEQIFMQYIASGDLAMLVTELRVGEDRGLWRRGGVAVDG